VVTLTVSDGYSSIDKTTTETITASPVSVSSITAPSTAAVCDSVGFTVNLGDSCNKDNLTYVWSFGDGFSDPDGGVVENHTYAAAGTYTIIVSNESLTLTAVSGLPSSATTCDWVSFSATALGGCDDSIKYTWDFGDDSETQSGQFATHTYSEPGTYTATVSAVDTHGGSASGSTTVTISSGSAPTISGLTATASGSDITLNWGSSSSDSSYYIIYRATSASGSYQEVGYSGSLGYTDSGLAPGQTYYYEVQGVNACGIGALSSPASASIASAGSSLTVTISPASATVDEGSSQAFTASYTPNSSPGTVSYAWYLDNNLDTSSTTASYSASFDEAGSHTVSCVVTDSTNGMGEGSASVTVTGSGFNVDADPSDLPVPISHPQTTQVEVSPENGYAGSVALTAVAQNSDGSAATGISLSWTSNTASLANGATSVPLQVSGSTVGNYSVVVTGTDSNGTTDSTTIDVTVQTGDFTLDADPDYAEVSLGGGSAPSTLTVSALDDFTGSVTLSSTFDGVDLAVKRQPCGRNAGCGAEILNRCKCCDWFVFYRNSRL
jgi:PKD repeat protein